MKEVLELVLRAPMMCSPGFSQSVQQDNGSRGPQTQSEEKKQQKAPLDDLKTLKILLVEDNVCRGLFELTVSLLVRKSLSNCLENSVSRILLLLKTASRVSNSKPIPDVVALEACKKEKFDLCFMGNPPEPKFLT